MHPAEPCGGWLATALVVLTFPTAPAAQLVLRLAR